MKYKSLSFSPFFFFLIFLVSISVNSQEEVVIEDEILYEKKLLQVKADLTQKENEKKVLEDAIRIEKDELILGQLKQELKSTEDVVNGLRGELVEMSTGGVELYEEPPLVERDFDWKKDLELIFDPVLSQLRQLGERPRKLEQLQADIVFWEKREKNLKEAVNNLQNNLDKVDARALKKELKVFLTTAESKLNTSQQKLGLLKKELSELEKESNPIWVTLKDVFSDIILAVVIHFFVALLVAFLVYQFIRLLSLIPIYIVVKRNPGETVFAERAIVVVRVILGVILAVIAYFVVLYSFSEWLVLFISMLLLAGIALALKNTLPKYFIEVKTMLNMGSLRQGERLMFDGLPWRITRLNVHTRLHNPALNAYIRVPLEEIVKASSRPYHKDEPWFPTLVGDVVFLEDDVFGKVIRQTAEIVEVDLGGSIYSYQTADFLSRRPRNLTREGFMIYETFGLDYQHQSEILTSILEVYKASVKEALDRSPFGEFNTYFEVEFDNASASSLDLKILAAFKGDVGMDFFKIKRLFQNASVAAANKHGWVIPFQQMTIHHQPVE